jgi:ABC-type branched-subunit amino acid transport system substrate-binding protein
MHSDRWLRRVSATVVFILAAGVVLGGSTAGADPPRPWRIGMVTALSGPAQALGPNMRRGVEAYFALSNKRGGVHGRPLELVARDDGYEPGKTGPGMRTLIDDEHVFAVVGNVGTPTAVVAVPIANEKHVPLFGAYTGASVLRKSPPDRYVINYRASYVEETAEMVRGLTEELKIPPSEIGFFTQNDAYGDAGWKGGVAALERAGYKEATFAPHGRYPRNTLDVEDGLSRLLDPRHRIRAVIMIGAYKPCARFIRLARKYGLDAVFINVSFVGSEALAKELGPDGDGVVVTQVVPPPEGDTPAAQEFQQAVPTDQRNYISFEGFLAAHAFAAALERSGADATPDRFVTALESGVPFDLGLGTSHTLSPTEHQFSHRVWSTVIRAGKLIPLLSWRTLAEGKR